MKNLEQFDEIILHSTGSVRIENFVIGYDKADFVENRKTIKNVLNSKCAKIEIDTYSALNKKERFAIINAKISELI